MLPRATSEEIANVVHQHEIYGLIPAVEIPRAKNVIHLIYSLDKPATAAQIMSAHEQNRRILEETGRTARKNAAIAGHDIANEGSNGRVQAFSTEITEEVGPTETPRVNERMVYGTDGDQPRATGRRRK